MSGALFTEEMVIGIFLIKKNKIVDEIKLGMQHRTQTFQ